MMYSFTLAALAAVASAQDYSSYMAASFPAGEYTSFYKVMATPDQVINSMNMPAPGQPGAMGTFMYAINSKTDTICYDITLTGVTGDYQSPANTATHIHAAVKGRSGPPRIAFPNPAPVGDGPRTSTGCLTGPFMTGIKGADNVTDTGAGFMLSMIEANPAGFFTDSHTKLFIPGVVRGQLDQDFKIVEKDGSAITTATLTSTQVVTLTSCPPVVTDCPYTSAPVVTMTEMVYTTVCPVSELPSSTMPAGPVSTMPVQTPGAPPMTSPMYPTTMTSMMPTGTAPGASSATTTGAQFTGAASANKVGGALFIAGLAAALL